MGFASRSVSMVRYRVRGEVGGNFWETIHEGVKTGKFRQFESQSDELGMGWTSIDDFTDTDFQRSSYLIGNYLTLSLRIDTVRVPPRILEMQYKKELRRVMDESGSQRVSSGQKRDLKERLKEALKKQVFPSIQVYDLIWDTGKAVVYFGSHSIKARLRFEEHFKKCFGLTVIPLLAYIRADELLAGHLNRQLLDQIKPSSMVP